MDLEEIRQEDFKGFKGLTQHVLVGALFLGSLYSLYVVIHPYTFVSQLHISFLDYVQLQRATHVVLLLFCGYLLTSIYTPSPKPSIGAFVFMALSVIPAVNFWTLSIPLLYRVEALVFLLLVFLPLIFPALRKSLDVVTAFLMLIPYIYELVFFQDLITRAMFPESPDLLMSFFMLFGLLGLIYRLTGPVLPCLVISFLVYNLYGPKFPGIFSNAPFSFDLLLGKIYCETEAGLFGIITGVSAKYLVYFTILGGVVGALRLGRIIANLASVLVGRGRDSAGKVTIISSIFMGLFSGSGAADTQFVATIAKPLYERSGYERHVAAGIAATAGTIAMVTPPVLGSMAFIMVEILSIPYWWVCVMALGPMIAYLMSIWFYNHFYAVRENLKPIEVSDILGFRYLLSYCHIFLPIIAIIFFIFLGYPVNIGVIIATFGFIVIAYVDHRLRPDSFRLILNGFTVGFRALIPIGTAVVAANIIMTLMVMTGLPSKFSLFITHISGQSLFIATFFAAFFSLILGMGVPPTATYVIASSLTAPAICQIAMANNIPGEAALLATHMFLMYYAILADVTPPVALSAYASSSVFGTHPLKTGIYAAKVALPKYIFGFSFILSYSGTSILIMPILRVNPGWESVVIIAARYLFIVLGIYVMSMATTGYGFGRVLDAKEKWSLGVISILFFMPYETFNLVTLLVAIVVGVIIKKGFFTLSRGR